MGLFLVLVVVFVFVFGSSLPSFTLQVFLNRGLDFLEECFSVLLALEIHVVEAVPTNRAILVENR